MGDDMEKLVERLDTTPKKKPGRPKKSKYLCLGLDVGTMNLVCSRSDSKEIRLTRNVFLPVNQDEIEISELTDISYVKSDDEIFIIGEDAFKFANIFAQQVSRPMENGLISSREISAIDVLTLMIKNLIGDIGDGECFVSYSVPAEAIDAVKSVTYHEKVFARILGSLGVNYTAVNEAMAIIYSECAKEKFSGIGISFGAGMANCAISYRGIEALKFSTARSGDWIDKNVAESLDMIPNRVTSIKEKFLDLEKGFHIEKNKKRRRILEALTYYYETLMNYTIKKIIKEFEDKVEIEIDEEIPLIISGGTSLPNGFVNLFKDTLANYELPFEISEIRAANHPLTSVSNGLLVKTMADVASK